MGASGADWYKDAIFYELRIRSFFDSNGDGIGDIQGLTQKLDYLHDLGITTIWLLPFYPSPLRDDGYDIADYSTIHPDCGTLKDFKAFLREAHARGLRVVTELVLNHTSDQHEWFQRARRAPAGSKSREFYVWSDSPTRYADARIIFKDFEQSNWSWDPVAGAYYWHRFFSNQPDLNFDNPDVRRALFQVVDFWLDMGVDGLRLDAVPYLFEREHTSCENLPETHDFLKELRAHVDGKFTDKMLLAEANQWPEDAVEYFGDGNECHTAFHFPVMPRLFMAIEMEDRHPIIDILDQTPAIPDNCQWLMFLRNHDELTLEMVTDEERDYMVRAYAADPRARINLGIRRRLAPLLEHDRRRIELMNVLLFSLPGTPVLYYGDEIGMGDNIYLGDRNGGRTPMQWSPDRNAGFSSVNPQRLILPVVTDPEYHYEAVNVEVAQSNNNSLLWWTKRLIDLRRQHEALGRGTLEALHPANRKVLTFLRHHEGRTLLVVVNLSRFSQFVELDLRRYAGRIPRELFGHVDFPRIGELPYLLTLGAYGFYWFDLTVPEANYANRLDDAGLLHLETDGAWSGVLTSPAVAMLEDALPEYLRERRWYRSKARAIRNTAVTESITLSADLELALVRVEFFEGTEETYVLPLAFAESLSDPSRPIARLRARGRSGVSEGWLLDASDDPRIAELLLAAMRKRRRTKGKRLELTANADQALRRARVEPDTVARSLGAEQSNTSWIVDDRYVLKLFRKLEDGANPELEISRHLAKRRFSHVPQLLGHADLAPVDNSPASTLAVLQARVVHQGDAWKFTLDEVERYFERALAASAPGTIGKDDPAIFGGYLELAGLLGKRTAELHVALGTDEGDAAFTPEPFSPFARRSLYQSLRNLVARVYDVLGVATQNLPKPVHASATEILARREEIMARFATLLGDERITSRRIRIHGDYHLGQVLYVHNDFVIIDFEGEPARALGERKIKRSPLADVAGMLRSFDYAVESVLAGKMDGTRIRREDVPHLRPWAERWCEHVSKAFLDGYLATAIPGGVVADDTDEIRLLLDIHLLEKALYEVAYELNNRPDWVAIPLRGITRVLAEKTAPKGSY
jgi:maltose alpha-D-glucosyltransferase/alpha-amylase